MPIIDNLYAQSQRLQVTIMTKIKFSYKMEVPYFVGEFFCAPKETDTVNGSHWLECSCFVFGMVINIFYGEMD